MLLDEFTNILRSLIPFGLGVSVAAVVLYLLQKYWLSGYLTEKGKNFATKENIAEITDKVEAVKRQHAELLEGLKTKNQLRLAGLEHRLRAHQEAYGLWREINGALDKPAINEVVSRCDSWWGDNCLYLEPAARSAFLLAFVGARDLEFYKSSAEAALLVSKTRAEINRAGSVIEECVALPHLNELAHAKRAA